jgi:hypothetical protein
MLRLGRKGRLKWAKVLTKKKTGPIKIDVPRTKSRAKRPSDVELTLAKPVKRMKKFVLSTSQSPVPIAGIAGASASKAPIATTKKAVTPV